MNLKQLTILAALLLAWMGVIADATNAVCRRSKGRPASWRHGAGLHAQ